LAFAVTGPYPKGKWQPPISTRYSVWLTLSEDNGQTWLPPRSLKVSPLAYGSPYGKIVSLPDGTLLLPVYQWDEEQRYGSYILRSRDGGWNWDEPTLIAEGHNEAALTVLPDGTLLAVVRRNDNSLSECYSEDGGRTWTPPQKLTEAPYHLADVIVLSSGRVLLTFGRRIELYGSEAVLGEFENGRVKWLWETRTLIEWRAANPDCGYPSSVQLDDGTIVTLVYGVGLKDDTVEGAFCVWIRYREGALLRP
jgi:sialidase-1